MKPDRRYQITSARLCLNIVEWGPESAPPLFLQHGGRDHCRSWDAIAGSLAGEYRVIAPDLRGHGDSEWTNDGAYHPIDMAYDVKSIFDKLALSACYVVGHSLGGNVVTRFAGLFPDRVTKLINIEGLSLSAHVTPHEAPDRQLEQLRNWIPRHALTSGRTPKRFPDLSSAIARMLEINQRLPFDLARHLVVEGSVAHPDGSVSFKYDPGIMSLAPIDIPIATRYAIWQAIECPVLVIYGTESWAGNPTADERLDHFRNVRLQMYEKAGHWVQHDRQIDVIAAIRTFLAE